MLGPRRPPTRQINPRLRLGRRVNRWLRLGAQVMGDHRARAGGRTCRTIRSFIPTVRPRHSTNGKFGQRYDRPFITTARERNLQRNGPSAGNQADAFRATGGRGFPGARSAHANRLATRCASDLILEGQVPHAMFVLKTGMACRYRVLQDGRRKILTFLLPGDLCDLHVFLIKEMDHSIAAITPAQLAAIARDDIMNLLFRNPHQPRAVVQCHAGRGHAA